MNEDTLVFDSVLDLCQNQHRRIILGALAEAQRPLNVDELTDAILEHNHQMVPVEAPEDVLTHIHRSLYHVHLPMLAADGFINHDATHKLVEPTEQLAQAQPTLSAILDADPSLEAPIELPS